MGGRWSTEESRSLFHGIGTQALRSLRKATGDRTAGALYQKARRMGFPGGLRRGSWSLRQVMDHTQYTRTQLERARDALNLKWRRTRPRGPFILTDDQVEDMVAWLKHDYWDKDRGLYGCVWCTTSQGRPKGLGLCSSCYYRWRRCCDRGGVPAVLSELTSLLEGWGYPFEDALVRLRKGIALTQGQLQEVIARVEQS